MTMKELSESYRQSAELLRNRLRLLRAQRSQEKDPEEQFRLERRIQDLTPMLTQMNELAELTEHYYDRGYWRGDKYTV